MLAALFIAVSAGVSLAQEGCDDTDKINELDGKIRAGIKKTATLNEAINAGKEFLEKFGACEATEEFTKWLKSQLPTWETKYAKFTKDAADAARFKRFDDGIVGEKYEESYAAGREILAADPDNLNIIVPLGTIGLFQSYNKNYKYNDDTLRYAKIALDKLKAGAASTKTNGKYGAFGFEYTKEDAISELTYAIAYINYWAKNDKKGALPFYYQVTQLPGKNNDEPRAFQTIGGYYVEEAAKLGEEIAKMIEKQKALPTDEEKLAMDAQIKEKVGLFNGYTERAIDAFSRAHKVAPTATAADKTYKEGIFKTIQDLYKRRFDKEVGLNEYIAAVVAKPFPDPTSAVTPVNDPDPVTTTTTTTGGVGAASGNGVGAASGNGVGAASGNGVGAVQGNTTKVVAPVKQVAKKPKR